MAVLVVVEKVEKLVVLWVFLVMGKEEAGGDGFWSRKRMRGVGGGLWWFVEAGVGQGCRPGRGDTAGAIVG